MATLTTKTAAELPKDQSAEETPGRLSNRPGVYEHKAASAAQDRPVRLIVLPDARTSAQADALVRMGFERVADAPSRVEIAQMQADQLKADQAAEAKGADPTAVQQNAPDPEAEIFNGSSDRLSSADKDAALKSALARAEAAEAALAEAAALPEAPAEDPEPEADSNKESKEGK